jgi:beta-glucosidase-like glycosyl hydrolase
LQEADGDWTRHNISVNISNYTLSDAYFPAFRSAIKKADAQGVMCSYNAVNLGEICSRRTLCGG